MYKKVKGYIGDFLLIIIGAFFMGTALSVFFVPFKITSGGVAGIATVIHYIFDIRVSLLIVIINIPIFVLGFIFFKTRFLVRSLFGTVMLSVATEVMTNFSIPANDTLLACLFGGGAMGFGIALVLKGGGTTGGTDIAVLIIRKFRPNFTVGRLFLIIDGVIIVLAALVFKNIEVVMYSIIGLLVTSYVSDLFLEGIKSARVVYIFSPKTEEITEAIYKVMKRGVTAVSSVSMYTGKNGRFLICVIRKRELSGIKKIIKEADENAFVVISDAKDVLGNGFEIKTV